LLCSVVVPVFNERENVRPLVEEIDRALAGASGPYEIVLVDDGSTDGSDAVMRQLASERRHLRVLRLAANAGQSAALAAGFRAVRAPVVVTLDADLQNDPAEIPRLIALLAEADVVSGVRVERHDAWRRRVASRIANAVRRRIVGDSTTDVGCSLKAYRSALLSGVPYFDGIHRFLPGLLERQGARVVEVPVRHRARRFGESKYTIGGRLRRGLVDLLGVRWLAGRWIAQRDVRWLTPPPAGHRPASAGDEPSAPAARSSERPSIA